MIRKVSQLLRFVENTQITLDQEVLRFELESFTVFLEQVPYVEHDAGLVALGIVVGVIVVLVNDEPFPVFDVAGNVLELLLVNGVGQDVVAVAAHQGVSNCRLSFSDSLIRFVAHHLHIEALVVIFFSN